MLMYYTKGDKYYHLSNRGRSKQLLLFAFTGRIYICLSLVCNMAVTFQQDWRACGMGFIHSNAAVQSQNAAAASFLNSLLTLQIRAVPANTYPMLAQRRRRWPTLTSIGTMSCVSWGVVSCYVSSELLYSTYTGCSPPNKKRWPSGGLMLGHRLRRWLNIEPPLGECFVFAVCWVGM